MARPELVRDGDAVSQMNQLAAICVKRPVFATVLILVLVVFGVSGYTKLGVDRFPKVDFPDHHRDHASARLGAGGNRNRDHRQDRRGGQHGQRHRRAAFGLLGRHLAGLRPLPAWRRTSTWPRRTCATRSTGVLPELPEDVEQPTVEKMDPDSSPVLSIAVSAPAPATLRDITEYCDKVLRRQLESLERRGAGDARRRPGPANQRAARSAQAPRLQADRGRRGQRLGFPKPADAQRLDEGRRHRVHAADHGPRGQHAGDGRHQPWPTATATRSPSAIWAIAKTPPRRSKARRSTTTRPAC